MYKSEMIFFIIFHRKSNDDNDFFSSMKSVIFNTVQCLLQFDKTLKGVFNHLIAFLVTQYLLL